MFRKLRKFTGLFLVLLAVLLLAAWEVRGREMVLMDDVLAAQEDIAPGEALDVSMVRVVSVPGNTLIADAVTPKTLESVTGMIVTDKIPAGGQISERVLSARSQDVIRDESFFVLIRGWILMRSSSLRRGDHVEIATADGSADFGIYRVAFVKDDQDREVEDIANGGLIRSGDQGEGRVNGTSMIDHVEIICTPDAYKQIREYAEGQGAPSLILIRREDR
ncbi:MAG: SAF domain-containing protein [Clostridiales Family XIII bacterium]|jgi:hypothetical protein|nr:SAF domain-containing protein [Clostridiales Family XIII bacterium]